MQGQTKKIDASRLAGGLLPDGPEHLGKYEIVERIGEGGFGVVYKGFDPFIKRHVAIKTCTSSDRELRQRYFREAEIAGRLDHPNIVRIFDFGMVEETPFLVQEFLAGEDLDDKIEGRQFLPYPERVLYLIHIARGLEYAHDNGVIHRDIKPANIRILDDGTAKIMDFGVAMLEQAETRLTKEDMAVGTAAYLAPEQIRGNSTDQRTDIFSYGVLAYELLTGERPFEQDTISATLYSILNDDPRPITLAPSSCPESLRQLIYRCMHKDPARRCPDFGEVLKELDRVRRQMRLHSQDRNLTGELRRVAPDSMLSDRRPTAGRAPVLPRSFDPPIRPEWTPPSIRMQRRRRWGALVGPAALLALAATSYALLAGQGRLPWPISELAGGVEPAVEELSSSHSGNPLEKSNGDIGPETELRPGPASGAAAESPRHAPLSVDDEAALLTAAPEEADKKPQPAPPSPVIQDAIVRFGKSWHRAMTVTIDGEQTLNLSRARSRELEPGQHELTFSLVTPDYEASRTVRVSLESGEDRTISCPIAPLGHLTVQANLGSPQGSVAIDGKRIGVTPLRSYRLAPGRHRLQVFSLAGPDLPLTDIQVDVRSSRETVITFDLTGRQDLAVRYRDLSG